MIDCVKCGYKDDSNPNYKFNTCDSCSTPKEFGMPALKEVVFIKDYGYTEKSRIKEMERRTILPYEHSEPGGYYLGRRGDNGKIQEKEPDY